MSELSRRTVGALPLAFLAAAAPAQDAPPRVVFDPPLGVAQRFRVDYQGGVASVVYRLSVTPVSRQNNGFRLRVLVDEVPPRSPHAIGMDMPVAATMMMDGLPIDMLTNDRGSIQEVADWPRVQASLRERANTLPWDMGARGVAYSVFHGHDAKQVVWHLTRPIEAMSFAISYLERTAGVGASTINWFGTPIDVVVAAPDAAGAVAISWSSPGGDRAKAPRENVGRALLRRNGFAEHVEVKTRESIKAEAIPSP